MIKYTTGYGALPLAYNAANAATIVTIHPFILKELEFIRVITP
jgi:hypothetical protein